MLCLFWGKKEGKKKRGEKDTFPYLVDKGKGNESKKNVGLQKRFPPKLGKKMGEKRKVWKEVNTSN